MTYSKTEWINDKTKITAEAMNNIESGVETASLNTKENEMLLANIKADANEQLDTFKEVADAINSLNDKIDVDKISVSIEKAIEDNNLKISYDEPKIIQDKLSGLYNIESNSDGNVLLDQIGVKNIQLKNSKVENGKLRFPINGHIKISDYVNKDAFTLFVDIKGIGSAAKEAWFCIATFGSNTILSDQQRTCGIMIYRPTLEFQLRSMHGNNSNKKPYKEGWFFISYDGKYLNFGNELDVIRIEVREFDKDNIYLFNGGNYDTATLSLDNLIIYDKALTAEELNYNFCILNNKKMVNKMNDLYFSSDTNNVIDFCETTQENINESLYKKSCREFASNGEDIVVENGLDGYLLSARMEGFTIKNLVGDSTGFNSDNSWFVQMGKAVVNDGIISIEGINGGYFRPIIRLQELKPNTTYTASIDIDKYTILDETDMLDLDFYVAKESGIVFAKEKASCKYDFSGTLKFTFTTDTETKWVMGLFGRAKELEAKNIIVVEGEDLNSYFEGLNSTRAIISNNGIKYSFYDHIVKGKTIVMKALKGTDEWIEISANETRDVDKYDYKLEAIDDGLGSALEAYDYIDRVKKVKVINTKEIVLDGNEASAPHLQREDINVFKISVPDVINERGLKIISNNVKTLDILNGTVNEEGICTYNGGAYIAISKTKVPNLTSSSIKEYLKQQKENGAPFVIRYKLETPLEIPMTNEEIAKYDSYKQVIELHKAGDVADTLEILESGNGVYTQRLRFREVSPTENWIKEKTENDVSVCFCVPRIEDVKNSTENMLSNLFPYKKIWGQETTTEGTYMGGNYFYIRILKSKLNSYDVNDFKEWLESNRLYVVYELATPITTIIPKELMPTIITYETNKLSFDNKANPSNVTINIPTLDTIKKTYDITLLNNYVNTNGSIDQIVALESDCQNVKIQMSVTAPSSSVNSTIFSLPQEIRPKTDVRIELFVNNVAQLATIYASTGKVVLANVPASNAVIYINTKYRRDL